MRSSPHIVTFGITLATLAYANPFDLPPDFHRFSPPSLNITWAPCAEGSNKECGRFEVPLDYQNATAGKASIAVARYPAAKQPKLGTLFFNPGGPGASGVEVVLDPLADQIMAASGGRFDVVSWDPRGVGLSLPYLACFANATEESAFWEGTIPYVGLEARSNFTSRSDLDAFYAQVPEVDELLVELGQRCLEYTPDSFQYVGTAAVVRDMVTLHDYLEGPEKPLNYWGFSYGTAIGIYFVNMFPNRVGRVVLDGVVDPIYWANRPAHEIWSIDVESADEALTGFVSACAAAGPENCAIASKNSTADSLREEIRQLIDDVYDYRQTHGPGAKIPSSANVRFALFDGMYKPTEWPQLASSIKATRDSLDDVTRHQPFNLSTREDGNQTRALPPTPFSIKAITCADAVDPGNVTTKMVFDELVQVTRDVSPMFGPMWAIAGLICHRWPIRAVERYTGPWNKKLSNPILVIGNEADPITPFRSAKSVADALGDSAVLIEQDDYGHASLAMRSSCTLAALETYFLNNELPSVDKFCGTNQVLFPGPGVTKSTLSALANSGNSSNLATSSNEADLEAELDKAYSRSGRLFFAVIALACTTGLLLIAVIVSCVLRERGNKAGLRRAHSGRDAFDKASEGPGHGYNRPYDAVETKRADGYVPVVT